MPTISIPNVQCAYRLRLAYFQASDTVHATLIHTRDYSQLCRGPDYRALSKLDTDWEYFAKSSYESFESKYIGSR